MGATFVSLRPRDDAFLVTVRLPPRPDEELEADSAADGYALGVLARIAAANERLVPPPLDSQLES
jgi:hypothetical protein